MRTVDATAPHKRDAIRAAMLRYADTIKQSNPKSELMQTMTEVCEQAAKGTGTPDWTTFDDAKRRLFEKPQKTAPFRYADTVILSAFASLMRNEPQEYRHLYLFCFTLRDEYGYDAAEIVDKRTFAAWAAEHRRRFNQTMPESQKARRRREIGAQIRRFKRIMATTSKYGLEKRKSESKAKKTTSSVAAIETPAE
jgi:hypothetical protein